MTKFYFFFYSIPQNTHDFNWSTFWTAVASIVTLFALGSTWWFFFRGKRDQRSLFYLNKIESYYSEVTTLLNAKDNNNINWHQAIESLKMAESLVDLLKEQPHQNICVMNVMSTGFRIINIIKDIDDFRFFYGLPDYKNTDSASLYQQSNPQSLETPHLRIDPTALHCLCAFIDKVNRIFNDSNFKNTPYHQIFNSNYFKSSIKNAEISGFTEITMKIVLDYIRNFKEHDTVRNNSQPL
ncbi:TPA: hypothetical protein KKW64_001256 [Legionella pneumophila]|nr:hypothetical protein [Legionella pneumophila]